MTTLKVRGNLLKKLFGASPQEQFWRWFEENSDELFGADTGREPILDELAQRLNAIDENLVFEMSPILNDSRREFVISADGVKRTFPMVRKLVSEAPRFSLWKITAFRQPTSARAKIRMEGYELSQDDIWFEYKQNTEDGLIELVLYIKDLSPEVDKFATSASFILLDAVLGEYAAATRIGAIERKSLPASPQSRGLQPFHKLKEIVGIRGQG